MDQNHITIRELRSSDGTLYRALRLEALKQSPEAFGSTFEIENERPVSQFAEMLVESVVFGAFERVNLIGIAGCKSQSGPKTAHKGILWGMYIQPSARNRGVGKQLLDTVINYARQHVELLQLTVVKENASARKLYSNLGFVEYGVELKALKHADQYYDEVLMVKTL